MIAPPTRQATAAPAMSPEWKIGPGATDLEACDAETVGVGMDNEFADEVVAEAVFPGTELVDTLLVGVGVTGTKIRSMSIVYDPVIVSVAVGLPVSCTIGLL
jgi:hypothetical protein